MTAARDRNPGPKVLMTADTVGGVWSYALGLCRALPETRFIVAAMGPRARPSQIAEIAEIANVTLVESGYRLEWMADAETDFAESCDWLAGLARRHDVDVIHVNGYAHALLGIDRPALVAAHSDVLSWWEAVYGREAPPEWGRYRRRAAAGLAAATRVVAPTGAALDDIERRYVGLAGRGAVIPNGIEIANFPSLPKRPVVLAAGRLWDAAKNLAALDAVAPELAWPVEIAGAAEHPESGTAEFAHVRLLGRLNPAEMARNLASAAIFAAPARYEPFGLAILEAAAARCALVLGDIPSLRENWDGAAIFVDPQDPRALRAALDRLTRDGNERTRLAAAAQHRARCFPQQQTARAYAALYRDLAPAAACRESA